MKTCTRHSNSVRGGALRVLATQATLTGSSRKPGSRKAPPGAERPSKTAGCEVWCACS
ncbi:MAG: hypothetical protein QF860_00130 [Planctomycetota bacterium]|nr:hypothetical protein [Planctomycetota bacterium]